MAQIGFDVAHLDHTPACTCKHRQKSIHGNNCKWINNLISSLNNEHGGDGDGDDCIKLQHTVEGDYFCCCGEYNKITHDESSKFQLIINGKDRPLFDYLQRGTAKEEKPLKPNNSIQNSTQKIFGRNQQIFELFNYLNNSDKGYRIFHIKGKLESGKSTLIRKVAQYSYERGYYYDIEI